MHVRSIWAWAGSVPWLGQLLRGVGMDDPIGQLPFLFMTG